MEKVIISLGDEDRKMRSTKLLHCGFAGMICMLVAGCYQSDLRLRLARENFQYKGKPIHPGLVEEFHTFISDGGPPVTVSLNISASLHARDEYFWGDVVVDSDVVKHAGDFPSGRTEGYFSYEYLGSIGHFQVLRTEDRRTSKYVSRSIDFVKFSLNEGGNLIMEIVYVMPAIQSNRARISRGTLILPDADGKEAQIFSAGDIYNLAKSVYRETGELSPPLASEQQASPPSKQAEDGKGK